LPLLIVVRFLLSLVSLAILLAAGYLLVEWYDGTIYVRETDGSLIRHREQWMLWLGVAALAFSALGRFVMVPLLARPDTDPSRPERGAGSMIKSATGAELYVESVGPPGLPTIVLTHGWSLDSTIWFYARRDLLREFRVVSWDLPGLGKSREAAPSGIDLAEFARDLRSVVEWTEAPEVVLVGHSIGGMTIQTLARDMPDFFNQRVAGAVLLNTTYTNPLKTMIVSGLAQAIRWPLLEPIMRLMIVLQPLVWLGAWQSYFSGSAHLANRLGFGKFVTRSQLEHATLLSTRNAPGNVMRGNLAMFRWDATGAVAKVARPLLVIGGEVDIVTLPAAGAGIAASAPRAEYRPVEGVNHLGFLEQSSVYDAEIARFARACLAPQSPSPSMVAPAPRTA
jgi:pimeloyl-ACP methyl ester carboxylesterase